MLRTPAETGSCESVKGRLSIGREKELPQDQGIRLCAV